MSIFLPYVKDTVDVVNEFFKTLGEALAPFRVGNISYFYEDTLTDLDFENITFGLNVPLFGDPFRVKLRRNEVYCADLTELYRMLAEALVREIRSRPREPIPTNIHLSEN